MQDKDSITNQEEALSSQLSEMEDSSELDSNQNLDSKVKALMQKRIRSLSVEKSFSGPLPSPEFLKAYDIVVPGLATRIYDLAEQQANHRMELEKAVILGDINRSWTGLILGFIIACLFLASSTYLILQGHDLAGGLLGGSGLVSLVGVFVYGTNKRSQERKDKRNALLDNNSED